MGIVSRLATWLVSKASPEDWFREFGGGGESVTGIHINQSTALSSSTVLAAVTILSEDVAKLGWSIYRKGDGEAKKEAKDHFLYDLLQEPNEWMNGLELREMMMVGLVLRGDAYAIIRRNMRGQPTALIPWNPDHVAQYLAADGNIFYRLTATNVHEQFLIKSFGGSEMIPFEDVLHIRGFSLNGLSGLSRISLARESIALGLAQEQQAARWMGQGAKPSGMLTTDQTLSESAAKRLAEDFRQNVAGLNNSGKIIVGEQGLKFIPYSMTSSDLEFIASRDFQMKDVARVFRIPPHMLGEMTRGTSNSIAQMAQEYINFTLTGYTNRWSAKLSSTFGLRKQGLSVDFDYRDLTTADLTSRINNHRIAIMSMMEKPDEARIDLGLQPEGGDADKLQFPQNMAAAGSQSTGTAPEDAGRPPEGGAKEFDDAEGERRHLELIEAVKAIQPPPPPPPIIHITNEVTTPDVHIEQAASPPVNVTVPITMPRKGVERTTVTKHDGEGRILEFERSEIDEEDSEQT